MPCSIPTCLLVCGPRARDTALDDRLANERFCIMHVARDARTARRVVAQQPFDAVLIDAELPDDGGPSLLAAPFRQVDSAYLLVGGTASVQDLRQSLRIGVRDVFDAPVDIAALVARTRELMDESRRRRDERMRVSRLRAISSRVMKDRREVRRRVNLVCRDLVGAYHELAVRINDMERAQR